MKCCRYYLNLILLGLLLSLNINLSALAIEELDLKLPSWINKNESEKVILKGNVNETVENVKPLTGIGVIGLRFIHQAGYPSFIEQVYPNSPASRAGIQPRDLIFAIDGIRTDYLSSDHVYQLLTGEPGTKVKIFITRNQTMFNVELAREDLANFSPDIQNRYLSGPIAVPINPKDFLQYH